MDIFLSLLWSEPVKPWAGNPKGKPGKPFESPGKGNPACAKKAAGPAQAEEDMESPSIPKPESLEAVPLAEFPIIQTI